MKKLMLAIACTALMAGITNVNAQGTTTAVKAAPQDVKATQREVAKEADPVDPTSKGPKGEVVYKSTKGGKYYLAPNGGKIYMDAKVDPTAKGPKGQPVYVGPGGKKYFIDGNGDRINIGSQSQPDKTTPVKAGTVKKAESAPDQK